MKVTYKVCTKCGKRRDSIKFYTSPKGRVCTLCQRENRREHARKRRVGEYDITPKEYWELFELQGRKCAACGEPRAYNLHIDHDHKLERQVGTRLSIRGLLCARCNSVLRKIRDNPKTAEGLARYLLSPPARSIIR